MDGDASDDPSDLQELLKPLIYGEADLVIGSRILGDCDPGALTPQQRFGNTLACWLQVRALKLGMRCAEIPVHYRARIGVSKISGTLRGVVLAGYYILGTIFWEATLSKIVRLKNMVWVKGRNMLQSND